MEPVTKSTCARLWIGLCLAMTFAAGVSHPAYAHHSLSAQYDYDWPFKFENAVLTKASFVNPHVHLYFTVKNEKGEVEQWEIATVGIRGLNDKGLGKEVLKVGGTYTIRGLRAHNGATNGFLAEIVVDGKSHIVWSGDPTA
jgi:Family of unknown function (DUF6152)